MLYDTELASPVGVLTLLAEEDALLGLWIAGQKFHGSALLQAARRGDCPALRAAEDWLARYFAGQAPDPWALSLRPAGTAFQRRVWEALRRIPYGATRSYGDLARELGTSPRAVGAAAGRNPISILIPCHRLMGADGNLTGYAGGLAVKEALLRLEGV
ncbi:MAG: methylated-DNA--[Oscillospiraceae bacterium]|nr:methylated-DNA--[protein]-cysteine S-methyltransferase [Oscillospiraceae bacterium]MBR6096919.1 methylated-DNA--[protein]-cysteine S-methyltransferase [Oscillospiraceae bacterium]